MYFLHEMAYLRDANHPNVLRLLGRCLEADPYLLILERCGAGDAKEFLQRRSPAERQQLLNTMALNKMAMDAAAGLQHLHDIHYTHSDLAARSCRVMSNRTLKIGDYGCNIDRYKEDYYIAGDVALPVRWCAPEILECTPTTIETKEVTKASNVWSLGVLMWELLAFAALPYAPLSDDDVIQHVVMDRNVQLSRPKLSTGSPHTDRMYHVMQLCWLPPGQRPTVHRIHALLSQLTAPPRDDFEERWEALRPRGRADGGSDSESPEPASLDSELHDALRSLDRMLAAEEPAAPGPGGGPAAGDHPPPAEDPDGQSAGSGGSGDGRLAREQSRSVQDFLTLTAPLDSLEYGSERADSDPEPAGEPARAADPEPEPEPESSVSTRAQRPLVEGAARGPALSAPAASACLPERPAAGGGLPAGGGDGAGALGDGSGTPPEEEVGAGGGTAAAPRTPHAVPQLCLTEATPPRQPDTGQQSLQSSQAEEPPATEPRAFRLVLNENSDGSSKLASDSETNCEGCLASDAGESADLGAELSTAAGSEYFTAADSTLAAELSVVDGPAADSVTDSCAAGDGDLSGRLGLRLTSTPRGRRSPSFNEYIGSAYQTAVETQPDASADTLMGSRHSAPAYAPLAGDDLSAGSEPGCDAALLADDGDDELDMASLRREAAGGGGDVPRPCAGAADKAPPAEPDSPARSPSLSSTFGHSTCDELAELPDEEEVRSLCSRAELAPSKLWGSAEEPAGSPLRPDRRLSADVITVIEAAPGRPGPAGGGAADGAAAGPADRTTAAAGAGSEGPTGAGSEGPAPAPAGAASGEASVAESQGTIPAQLAGAGTESELSGDNSAVLEENLVIPVASQPNEQVLVSLENGSIESKISKPTRPLLDSKFGEASAPVVALLSAEGSVCLESDIPDIPTSAGAGGTPLQWDPVSPKEAASADPDQPKTDTAAPVDVPALNSGSVGLLRASTGLSSAASEQSTLPSEQLTLALEQSALPSEGLTLPSEPSAVAWEQLTLPSEPSALPSEPSGLPSGQPAPAADFSLSDLLALADSPMVSANETPTNETTDGAVGDGASLWTLSAGPASECVPLPDGRISDPLSVPGCPERQDDTLSEPVPVPGCPERQDDTLSEPVPVPGGAEPQDDTLSEPVPVPGGAEPQDDTLSEPVPVPGGPERQDDTLPEPVPVPGGAEPQNDTLTSLDGSGGFELTPGELGMSPAAWDAARPADTGGADAVGTGDGAAAATAVTAPAAPVTSNTGDSSHQYSPGADSGGAVDALAGDSPQPVPTAAGSGSKYRLQSGLGASADGELSEAEQRPGLWTAGGPSAGEGEELWAGRGAPAGEGEELWAGRGAPAGDSEELWAGRGAPAGEGEELWAGRGPSAGEGEELWADRGPSAGEGEELWAGLRLATELTQALVEAARRQSPQKNYRSMFLEGAAEPADGAEPADSAPASRHGRHGSGGFDPLVPSGEGPGAAFDPLQLEMELELEQGGLERELIPSDEEAAFAAIRAELRRALPDPAGAEQQEEEQREQEEEEVGMICRPAVPGLETIREEAEDQDQDQEDALLEEDHIPDSWREHEDAFVEVEIRPCDAGQERRAAARSDPAGVQRDPASPTSDPASPIPDPASSTPDTERPGGGDGPPAAETAASRSPDWTEPTPAADWQAAGAAPPAHPVSADLPATEQLRVSADPPATERLRASADLPTPADVLSSRGEPDGSQDSGPPAAGGLSGVSHIPEGAGSAENTPDRTEEVVVPQRSAEQLQNGLGVIGGATDSRPVGADRAVDGGRPAEGLSGDLVTGDATTGVCGDGAVQPADSGPPPVGVTEDTSEEVGPRQNGNTEAHEGDASTGNHITREDGSLSAPPQPESKGGLGAGPTKPARIEFRLDEPVTVPRKLRAASAEGAILIPGVGDVYSSLTAEPTAGDAATASLGGLESGAAASGTAAVSGSGGPEPEPEPAATRRPVSAALVAELRALASSAESRPSAPVAEDRAKTQPPRVVRGGAALQLTDLEWPAAGGGAAPDGPPPEPLSDSEASDVLEVDTESLEARLVAGGRPRAHLAFVPRAEPAQPPPPPAEEEERRGADPWAEGESPSARVGSAVGDESDYEGDYESLPVDVTGPGLGPGPAAGLTRSVASYDLAGGAAGAAGWEGAGAEQPADWQYPAPGEAAAVPDRDRETGHGQPASLPPLAGYHVLSHGEIYHKAERRRSLPVTAGPPPPPPPPPPPAESAAESAALTAEELALDASIPTYDDVRRFGEPTDSLSSDEDDEPSPAGRPWPLGDARARTLRDRGPEPADWEPGERDGGGGEMEWDDRRDKRKEVEHSDTTARSGDKRLKVDATDGEEVSSGGEWAALTGAALPAGGERLGASEGEGGDGRGPGELGLDESGDVLEARPHRPVPGVQCERDSERRLQPGPDTAVNSGPLPEPETAVNSGPLPEPDTTVNSGLRPEPDVAVSSGPLPEPDTAPEIEYDEDGVVFERLERPGRPAPGAVRSPEDPAAAAEQQDQEQEQEGAAGPQESRWSPEAAFLEDDSPWSAADALALRDRLRLINEEYGEGEGDEGRAERAERLRRLNDQWGVAQPDDPAGGRYTPDWEPDDEDEDGLSSTSGEFVWQDGADRAAAEAGAGSDSDSDSGSDSESESGEEEFTPSVWQQDLEPGHGLLRSPEHKSDLRKSVSFKRQKHHRIYEYPGAPATPELAAEEAAAAAAAAAQRKTWSFVAPAAVTHYTDWELDGEEIEDVSLTELPESPERCAPRLPAAGAAAHYFLSAEGDDGDEFYLEPALSAAGYTGGSSFSPAQLFQGAQHDWGAAAEHDWGAAPEGRFVDVWARGGAGRAEEAVSPDVAERPLVAGPPGQPGAAVSEVGPDCGVTVSEVGLDRDTAVSEVVTDRDTAVSEVGPAGGAAVSEVGPDCNTAVSEVAADPGEERAASPGPAAAAPEPDCDDGGGPSAAAAAERAETTAKVTESAVSGTETTVLEITAPGTETGVSATTVPETDRAGSRLVETAGEGAIPASGAVPAAPDGGLPAAGPAVEPQSAQAGPPSPGAAPAGSLTDGGAGDPTRPEPTEAAAGSGQPAEAERGYTGSCDDRTLAAFAALAARPE
ncbi:uncharacterized protein LOC122364588 [Amphibalanus amphitrite]|uniref:uncharacterized protein LOC122364588 n=1 Tax=Amphibalanus amphitrite TaxID=1232801 RepID=UPI001C90ED55|nr:uncharacterized protein LOC122364588 [Amphibalanus amphitrite]